MLTPRRIRKHESYLLELGLMLYMSDTYQANYYKPLTKGKNNEI